MSLLQTDTAAIGSAIEQPTMLELPLSGWDFFRTFNEPLLSYNEFGVDFGGPVKRDKTLLVMPLSGD